MNLNGGPKFALGVFAVALQMMAQSVTAQASELWIPTQSHYAPTTEQVNAVVAHLSKSGFVNIEVAPNNLLITADGSASSAKAAFNVDMQHFTMQGRGAYANLNDPVIPQELGGILLAVHGLQTVHLSHTVLVQAMPDSNS